MRCYKVITSHLYRWIRSGALKSASKSPKFRSLAVTPPNNTYLIQKDLKSVMVQLQKSLLQPLQSRELHTTQKAQNVEQILAALWGWRARRIYHRLPKQRRIWYWLAFIVIGFTMASHYYLHLERAPLAGHMRYMALSHRQTVIVSAETHKRYEIEYTKLPADHKYSELCEECVSRLVRANSHLSERFKTIDWKVSVLDTDKPIAVIYPDGQVYISTRMIEDLENKDRLANVLAHELVHAVDEHYVSMVSGMELMDKLFIGFTAFCWSILPLEQFNFLPSLPVFLASAIIPERVDLPTRRNIEVEADYYGLELAARACFDVREIVAFHLWRDFQKKYLKVLPNVPEEQSSHPSSSRRASYLENHLPKAIELFEENSCRKLPNLDPIEAMKNKIEKIKPMIR